TDANDVSIAGVGKVAASGSMTVTPAQTTTYTVVANGPGGSASASATVVVGTTAPGLSVTLIASPSTISSGNKSTLTWTTTSASSVALDNGIGIVGPTAGGSIQVNPSLTTTYTA